MTALPTSFLAKTSFGTFSVRITDGTYINVGGKNDCVQLGYRQEGEGFLDWLETDKGRCEMDNAQIHGKSTIAMTDLAFTVLRILYPDVKTVTLIDSATFMCTLANGRKSPMPYKQFFLLTKGKTYYEDRFNATPMYDNELEPLKQFRMNLDDPDKKPISFSFNNKDLNEELNPIYKESATWNQFIQRLKNKYEYNVCQAMFPWYMYAYATIMGSEITSYWKIDISERPTIEFEITNASANKYTRKNYVYKPDMFLGGSILYNMPYKRLINSSKTRKTTDHS